MKVPIRISSIVSVLPLFYPLVAAFPPAVQPRTTPNPPCLPATRIITSHFPSTDAPATPARTDAAAAIAVPSPPPPLNPHPPNTTIIPRPISHPAAAPLLKPYLDLRQYLSATPAAGPPGAATVTTTAFGLPSGANDLDAWAAKYHQTTFWSCVSDDVQTHCGWHEPVLPGGTDIGGAPLPSRKGRGWWAFGVAVVVVVIVWVI